MLQCSNLNGRKAQFRWGNLILLGCFCGVSKALQCSVQLSLLVTNACDSRTSVRWLQCVSSKLSSSGSGVLCDSYLVDPASSHMLVSKIKPCMSKYKHLYCETANGSLNQLSFI